MRWESKEAISIIYYSTINVYSNKLKTILTYKNKMNYKNKMINNKTMNKKNMNRITNETKNNIITNYINETKNDNL